MKKIILSLLLFVALFSSKTFGLYNGYSSLSVSFQNLNITDSTIDGYPLASFTAFNENYQYYFIEGYYKRNEPLYNTSAGQSLLGLSNTILESSTFDFKNLSYGQAVFGIQDDKRGFIKFEDSDESYSTGFCFESSKLVYNNVADYMTFSFYVKTGSNYQTSPWFDHQGSTSSWGFGKTNYVNFFEFYQICAGSDCFETSTIPTCGGGSDNSYQIDYLSGYVDVGASIIDLEETWDFNMSYCSSGGAYSGIVNSQYLNIDWSEKNKALWSYCDLIKIYNSGIEQLPFYNPLTGFSTSLSGLIVTGENNGLLTSYSGGNFAFSSCPYFKQGVIKGSIADIPGMSFLRGSFIDYDFLSSFDCFVSAYNMGKSEIQAFSLGYTGVSVFPVVTAEKRKEFGLFMSIILSIPGLFLFYKILK